MFMFCDDDGFDTVLVPRIEVTRDTEVCVSRPSPTTSVIVASTLTIGKLAVWALFFALFLEVAKATFPPLRA